MQCRDRVGRWGGIFLMIVYIENIRFELSCRPCKAARLKGYPSCMSLEIFNARIAEEKCSFCSRRLDLVRMECKLVTRPNLQYDTLFEEK